MASRSPAPGRYSWLEWGPREPGAGGGSQVRDADDRPVRTGDRVTRVGGANLGTVTELLAVDAVIVRWDGVGDPDTFDVGVHNPARLRVTL